MKLLFFIIVLVVFVSSCGKKEETGSEVGASLTTEASYSPLDYLKWVESYDGLRVSKRIEKIEFQLQYMPAEYMVVKMYKDSLNTLNNVRLKASAKGYEQLQYFKLRISIDDFNDEIVKYNIRNDFEYEERVKYYSFNMQHRLKLIDGNDTLPCVMYNYERTFNLTPNSNFQLAFPVTGNKSNKTLIIDDLYLGTGKVMMALPEEKIKSIPQIVF